MKHPDFPYRNVYEYLQALGVLDHGTEREIETARSTFRKLYQRHYQNEYSQQHIQINFRVTQKQYQMLKDRANGCQGKVGKYCKQLMLAIEHKPTDTKVISLLLMQVIDMVEEAIQEEEHIDVESVLELLEQMQEELR